jgi:glycosyltransferase involved in cell wall biosynthesis
MNKSIRKDLKYMPKISIITVVLNSASTLPTLIQSLLDQSDQDFEWVVRDGGSSDGTQNLIRDAEQLGLKIRFASEPDFGIYDALNRGIIDSAGTHYLVMGSDDCLETTAIENYRAALMRSGAPFVVANVRSRFRIIKPKGGSLLLNKQWVFMAGHSVGILIEKDLHKKYGFYSRRFPIAADQLFLEKAYLSGERFYHSDFLAGTVGSEGVSSTDVIGTISESFRIQVELTGKLGLNLVIFFLRLLKNFRKLK